MWTFFCRALLGVMLCVLWGCDGSPKKRGAAQQIKLNAFSEPPTLDPRKATDSTSINVLLMLFEGLTREEPDGKSHGALAEKIEVSEDQKTYTFHLREAYWSNGERVTTEDFLYSWLSILDPTFPSVFAYKLYPIQGAQARKEGKGTSVGIEALDEKRLVVTLKHPTPYFLELTSFPTYFPIYRGSDGEGIEWAGEAGPRYVNNGPFLLSEWEHESEMHLQKNPLYWDAEAVKLDSLHLTMVEDTATEFYMFEMDELDWAGSPISSLPVEFIPRIRDEGKLISYPVVGTYYYKLNTDYPLLENVHIRRALGWAIERQAIVDHVMQAGQLPAMALVPPLLTEGKQRMLFEENGAAARAEFEKGCKQLGYAPEEFPTLTLSHNTCREHQKVAQVIQQQWKEMLGIRVEIETCDWKVYLSKVNRQDYQIARMGWAGDFNDPITFLEPYKYREDPNNETGWENAEYRALLDAALEETEKEKRKAHLRKAEEILLDEMPLIPLFYIRYNYMKKPYVKNVYLSSLGIIDFKWAYLEEPA